MTSKDVQQKPEARSNMISIVLRPLGPVCLKLVTQDASGLCFRQSTYGWKANLRRKSIQVVSHQNPLESIGIVETNQHLESTRVLRHRLLIRWTLYHVWAY